MRSLFFTKNDKKFTIFAYYFLNDENFSQKSE